MNFNGLSIKNPRLFVHSLLYRLRSNSLLRNSIFIMGTGFATSIFGYFYWILAAHTYSAYDVGLGSALISAMTLASTLANLGMGSTLVQVLPGREKGRAWSLTLNAGLLTGLLAGLLTGIGMVIVLPLVSPEFAAVSHIGYTFVFIVGTPLMAVSTLLDQAFVAERAAHNMLIRNAVVAILKIPLLVAPILLFPRIGALGILLSGVLAIACSLFGATLLLVPRLERAYCLAVHGVTQQVRSMLSLLTGHYFINLGGLISMQLLPVFVAIRLSPVDNAYYYTTSKMGDFFLSTSAAVAVSLFAEGSYRKDDLSRKVRSSAMITAMFLVPAMLLCFWGGYYLLLVFGHDYAQHGLVVLRIDVIASVPDGITSVYISVLRVQKRLRRAALLNLGMASVTLSLAWFFLPGLNIAGASWAFLIAQSLGSLLAAADFISARRSGRSMIANDDQSAEDREPVRTEENINREIG